MPRANTHTTEPTHAVVIGLEIPGFAKLPVAAQCKQQEELQRRLAATLRPVAPQDRIVLDTPTGAAVVLFTSVASALNIACALCGTRSAESGSVVLRAGLATGPVMIVRSANGQTQIAGDALEVAEHIVTLHPAERLIATGAFATALRQDEPDCAPAFRALPAEGEARALEPVSIQITHPKILALRRRRGTQTKKLVRWLTAPRAALATAAAMLTVIIWSAVLVYGRSPAPMGQPILVAAAKLQPSQVESQTAPDPTMDLVAPTQAAAPPAEIQLVEHDEPIAQPPQPRVAKPKRVMQVKSAPVLVDRKVQESSIETADILAHNSPEHGKVMLAIAPWGEVLVNGKAVGVSPPLTELDLEAGSHYLEVRNGSAPPLLKRIDVQANETLKIRHRFADSQ